MAKNDFDVKGAIQEVKESNDGIKFEDKVREAIRRSSDVKNEIRSEVWKLLKEKIIWLIVGAFSFVFLELLKELGMKLIEKIH